jgi:hypothetical protein
VISQKITEILAILLKAVYLGHRVSSEGNKRTEHFVSANFPGPFVIQFHTDDSLRSIGTGTPVETTAQAMGVLSGGGETGFRLSYALTEKCYNNR